MHKIKTLPNGLTLITVDMPHLDSVTTLIAVGAGSRYETRKINGISHFLEHMFFKGSTKYPTAEQIATLVDGIGAVNNAATDKEVTYYWIKSAAKDIKLSTDILSSMVKESLLAKEEIEREKGVIIEELRMLRDNPARYVWDLYEGLQFGDQPLGWDIGGDEKTIMSLDRDDFISYMDSLYSPKNMAIVYAGKLPKDIEELAADYFADLPKRSATSFKPYQKVKQLKPKIDIFYKATDQANLVLGVEGFSRSDEKRHIARLLSLVLGEGMSSRLFIQVRERRGLAYHVGAHHSSYEDTGSFTIYAGLKLEKVTEGLEVILAELQLLVAEKVTDDELKKAKQMLRGRIALQSESTNFLAEYFGTNFVLDKKIETFDEILKKVDKITKEDLQALAKELFVESNFNLQVIGPFKEKDKFSNIFKTFSKGQS
ncbi:insulinase family protein [Candidatus Daviesbacteria bacterium]|nr:insulinase family protein [Candidatus Daviesbacteria bacterium]